MKRAIIVPAVPAPEALSELKQWLAISSEREDAALARLMAAAVELCEGFVGSLPLECTCEELLTPAGGWQSLGTRPVQAVLAIEGVPSSGPRLVLSSDAYELELDADSAARIRLLRPAGAPRIAVRFVAGLAPSWGELPEGLRHGLIRCAAHLYRTRDAGPEATPPAAVAALWRPWRRLRLA